MTALITIFNRGAEELLGYTAEETVGRLNGMVLLDPDEIRRRDARPTAEPARSLRSHKGELDEGIWTYIRKDGTRIEVLLTIRANFNRFGEIEGFLAFGRDVSELQQAEIARMQAEERFRIAFEHAPIGLAIASLEGPTAGCWTQTNPALARMLGHEPGELDGVLIDDITHPDDRQYTEGFLGELRGQQPIAIEKRFARKDGSTSGRT